MDPVASELRQTLKRRDELVDRLLEEQQQLLVAVSDLLLFQREAMDVISSVGWPNGSARRVEGLVDQFRRPTLAISKVRAAALAFTDAQPKQHELPLQDAKIVVQSYCEGPPLRCSKHDLWTGGAACPQCAAEQRA